MAADLGGIAQGMVTAAGLIGAGWGVARWTNRPRFICGIPPAEEERREKGLDVELVGRPEVSHGYRHRDTCFAHRLRRRHKRQLSARDRQKAADPKRCRTLRAVDDVVSFPVLVANSGHRIAETYTVSIIFPGTLTAPTVQLLDVRTESLQFNLAVTDPSLIRRPELSEALSDPALGSDYAYMSNAPYMDGIYLSGSIVEAGSYELVHVEARVNPDVDAFHVLYTISCSDGWMRDETYIQRCEVDRSADKVGDRATATAADRG